jgi:YD repeat-containing protein
MDNKLQSILERSSINQEALFVVEYANGRLQKATNGQDVISMQYTPANAPISADFSRAGISQSTFAMTYDEAGRMTSVKETRHVLWPNSLILNRTYRFSYDPTGNLTREHARFTLTDGTVVEQQTDYVSDSKPSPYTLFQALPLLTVVALSQGVETRPGRFWQQQATLASTTYSLTSTGTRGTLLEEADFVNRYDDQGHLSEAKKRSKLYQGMMPDPVTKQNQQNFTYTCF